MNSPTVSIVIPTLNAGEALVDVINALRQQDFPASEVIVIDSSSTDGTAQLAASLGCRTHTIARSEFNHGTTRNLGARMALGDIVVCLTQDALPANCSFLRELTRPIREGKAAAAVGRQRPRPNASPTDAFHREFNYGPVSSLRTLQDLPRLGVKAYFFSNVAAAYSVTEFWAAGGFPEGTVQNEDMILCARLLRAGQTVAYVAEAEVWHSHDYTLRQQFERYFDIGAAMARSSDELPGAKAGGEGLRFVRRQVNYLWVNGKGRWIPYALTESAIKFIAFHLGHAERMLPRWIKKRISMNSYYW